ARLGPLVGRHHERLDGHGYHRGCGADELSMPARILAAANAYRSLTEPRPHRRALEAEQAKQRLLDATGSALDADAVDAVLSAAGHTIPDRSAHPPAGLADSARGVLGVVTRGCSTVEIAPRLFISPRTAEHHVQHIYAKIGVSSRAAATLFAVEHPLLDLNR